MKVHGTQRSLIQGVSQQLPKNRIPGQCTLQENMSSNPTDGLKRRPPVEYLAGLFSSSDPAGYYEFEFRGEKYFMAFRTGAVSIYRSDTGAVQDLRVEGDALAYISPLHMRGTTLENTSYLVNTQKVVAMDSDTPDYVEQTSIVFLLGGAYGRTFNVIVTYDNDGTPGSFTGTFTTPDGSVSSHSTQISPAYIATQLETSLNSNKPSADFVITRTGEHIMIENTDADTTFTVATDDSSYNQFIDSANNRIDNIARVPRYAPHNYILAVRSSNSANSSVLYLRFEVTPNEGETVTTGTGFGRSGSWYEAVGPGIEYALDKTTMPHVLEYDDEGEEFVFKQGEWLDRRVGDDKSNEKPTFVGKRINHLAYFQGRLVLISGLGVIMSRTRDALDMWLRTVTALLDDDPIDVRSMAKNVNELTYAIPFNRDLVIFAANAQFIVLGRTTLTPRTASLVLTTTFEANLQALPVAAGRNVFYAIDYGRFAGIREFYGEGSQDINDSRPTSEHVIRYMEGTATHLASTSNFNMLLVQTSNSNRDLYVYEYLWADSTKLQSSWSKWIHKYPVEYVFFVESRVYAIMNVSGQRVLTLMDLDYDDDPEVGYQVLLDMKTYVEKVNGSFTLPWGFAAEDGLVLVQGEGCPYPGLRANYTRSGNDITLREDMQCGTVILGYPYMGRYWPTMPMVKDRENVKIGRGTLRVSKFIVQFTQSGNMGARVLSDYSDPVTIEHVARSVNTPSTRVGEPAVHTGEFIVPFREKVENAWLELFSDDETPTTINELEWEGTYFERGTRITGGE